MSTFPLHRQLNPKNVGNHNKIKTQTLPIYQASKEWKLGKINLEMGTHEECNYLRASTQTTPNSWSINHQHSPSLEEGRSLHKYENFGELPQTLIGISQSQTKCPNPWNPFPHLIWHITSNYKDTSMRSLPMVLIHSVGLLYITLIPHLAEPYCILVLEFL